MSRCGHTHSVWQKTDATPRNCAWFQGLHLDPWLGCVPVCACGYTMPPGDILWLVCERVGMSVLSPWQPFSFWFLYICSVIYSIWETAPHLISSYKADDRGLLLNGISFSPVSKASVFQCTHDCIKLQTEPSARPVGLRQSVRLQWKLTSTSWTCEDFSEARREPGVWSSLASLLSWMVRTWLDEPVFFIFSVSLSLSLSLFLFLSLKDLLPGP